MKKQIFPFLKKGYFSFPIKDKGKKFEVFDTYTIYLKDKILEELLEIYKTYSIIPIQIYQEIFWKAIKQEKLDKKFKNCWLVPINLSKINNEFSMDIDILKPVKTKTFKKQF